MTKVRDVDAGVQGCVQHCLSLLSLNLTSVDIQFDFSQSIPSNSGDEFLADPYRTSLFIDMGDILLAKVLNSGQHRVGGGLA
jgi:hypothetical protein